MRCPEGQFGCEKMKTYSVRFLTVMATNLTAIVALECAIVAGESYIRGARIRMLHPGQKTKWLNVPYLLD